MEIIKITKHNDKDIVSARELHKTLQSKRKFTDWFKAKVMIDPLFVEGEDWVFHKSVTNPQGGRPAIDYAITLRTAKKVAMMEHTAMGNKVRDYFLQVEKERNELIQKALPKSFAEALRMLADTYEEKERISRKLEEKKVRLELQEHVIKENAPKVEYYEEVLTSLNSFTSTTIAKELGMSAVTMHRLLKQKHIMYRIDGHWVLSHLYQNKGYTKTRTYTYTDGDGKTKSTITTVWTQIGREFIHQIFKNAKRNSNSANTTRA